MSGVTRRREGKGVKLRVKDAFKEDAGRGIVRIDPEIINQLSLRTGDVLEISHPLVNKRSAALLYPGKREDRGMGIIRIDPSLRRNLGASLDDIVEIRKIDAALANKVTFAGLEESIIVRTPQQLARKLDIPGEIRNSAKADLLPGIDNKYQYFFNLKSSDVDKILIGLEEGSSAREISKTNDLDIDAVKKEEFSQNGVYLVFS